MRVLVCGGRNYTDDITFCNTLNEYAYEAELVIHGGAAGADQLAQEWADHHGICCKVYPAQWSLYGKSAGPRRNQQMIDEENPDLVIAFPGGKGTADMVCRAETAGVRVIKVERMADARPG